MMSQGILLAGGSGTRLGPLTKSVNKHFLPIFDKPMIFYSISTMLLAGVKSLTLITNPEHIESFRNLLGDGSQWGIQINFAIQNRPEGIPQAFSIAEPYLEKNTHIMLGLGDNILYGLGTGRSLSVNVIPERATIYCFSVSNPNDFGVVEIDTSGTIVSLEEKPTLPKSNLAITGFYSFPYDAIEASKKLVKSSRGEFEIIDLLKVYNSKDRLQANVLPRGTAWLDAGSQEGLLESSEFVHALQKRQGLLVGSPDEAAWQIGNIDSAQLARNANKYGKSEYGKALLTLAERAK
jgi:glucose-1-phosphate thymidylyltransferase